MIAKANGQRPVSITGFGCHVPERVITNEELSAMVDTSDEWIMERTGIRQRHVAAPGEALSDLCLPAVRDALEQACVEAKDIDLIIVATITPDMAFPSTGALLADQIGARDAAAYDLSAGCTGFMYALAQAYGMLAGGLSERALVVGGDVLSRIIDWHDRSTCVLFGDGAGRGRARARRRGRLPRLRARRRRFRRRPPLPAGRRVAGADDARVGGGGRPLCAHERPRGVQVRHARARLVGARHPRASAGSRSTTSTSTSRTRRTCGSSTTLRKSSGSRRIASW